MTVDVFGYRLYPAFFIVVIGIPLVIAIILLILSNKKIDKKHVNMYRITDWQKSELLKILDKEISGENVSQKYTEIIRSAQGFISRKRIWDIEELQEIHPQICAILTTVFYRDMKDAFEQQYVDKAVLLCHTIDFINEGLEYNGLDIEWIGDDIESLKNHRDMTDSEARLLQIVSSSISKASYLIDSDISKIPESVSCHKVLKTFNEDDFEFSVREVSSSVDFEELSSETFVLAAHSLIHTLDEVIENLDAPKLPYFQIYLVRALACCMDRQIYTAILDTIEI